jgi:Fe2+ transport system protein FeoA
MTPLYALDAGECALIMALRCADPARLDRLAAFGLVPGSFIRLRQTRPAFILEIGATTLSVDRDVARDIWVQPALEAPAPPAAAD